VNRDLINSASPRRVAQAGMTVVDQLQVFQPHEQLMGAAALFLVLAEHWRIPAHDVFTATKNLMNSEDGKHPAFAAMQEYVSKELA
jgi:hypothetical protein